MINVIKAVEIMRKYCPETKLEIKDGCDGLYLTEKDKEIKHLHELLDLYDREREEQEKSYE